MKPFATSSVVIVSPHFDDAVLSCFSVLQRSGATATVVTVFGGAPPSGRLLPWDALDPATLDSHERVRERRLENRRALAVTRAVAVDLELLEDHR